MNRFIECSQYTKDKKDVYNGRQVLLSVGRIVLTRPGDWEGTTEVHMDLGRVLTVKVPFSKFVTAIADWDDDKWEYPGPMYIYFDGDGKLLIPPRFAEKRKHG